MYKTDIKVRFNHVDFAGIVFYPRYFEMFNQVIEQWWDEVLGVDFRALKDDFNAGVPAAHIDVDFTLPSYLSDVLNFSLEVKRLGESSFDLVLEAVCEGELRLRANLTLVYIVNNGSGNYSASEIPPNIKQLMLET